MAALAPELHPPVDLDALDHHYNGSRALYEAWSRVRHMHHGYATWAGPWTHEGMLDAMVDRVTDDLELPRQARVADLGCGYGAGARRLLRRRPDLRVDGFTVLPEQVDFMTEHAAPGLTPNLGDYCATGRPDGHYDGAFFLESIDYGTGAAKADALAEAARILRPGARLVVAGPFLAYAPTGLVGWLTRTVERAFAIDALAQTGPFAAALDVHGFELERNELASLRIAPTVLVGHLRALGLVLRRTWSGEGLDADERRHLTGGIAGLWLGLCMWAFQYRVFTARRR